MAKRILTLDIGATNVVLAEYAGGKNDLTLVNYGRAALAAPLDETNADTVLVSALQEIVRERGIRPGPVAISLSGQMAFPRFAAIPDVGDGEKFEQSVRFEIEQNIPFPLDEMICDRQVLGELPSGDKGVLVVAAKTDQIEAITAAVVSAGFSPELVGIAPIAGASALLAQTPDDGACRILLDLGAKTTSLVVIEGDRFYSRSIPVGGNMVTKEIAAALECSLDDAEAFKLEHGYVSLGGVVEDEDETVDRAAKICRTVMTRLHAEISRSVNFYRSQQGGGAPVGLYLTGGTSLLPQLDRYFAENLQVEVEYLNPFETIRLGPAVNADLLSTDAAYLAPTAGLALQLAERAHFTLNLLPPSITAARADRARVPVLVAAGLAFVAAGALVLSAVNRETTAIVEATDSIRGACDRLQTRERAIKAATEAESAANEKAETLRALLVRRGAAVARLKAVKDAIGDYLWIEKWEGDRITIRGWKDRIAEFTKKSANMTAPELVAGRLKASSAVIADSVKITDMIKLGRNQNVEQFVVEVKFQ